MQEELERDPTENPTIGENEERDRTGNPIENKGRDRTEEIGEKEERDDVRIGQRDGTENVTVGENEKRDYEERGEGSRNVAVEERETLSKLGGKVRLQEQEKDSTKHPKKNERYGIPIKRNILKGMKNTALVNSVNSLLMDMSNKVYDGRKLLRGRLIDYTELRSQNLILQEKVAEIEGCLGAQQNCSSSAAADILVLVVTDASNLPTEFLLPSNSSKLVIGFSCEVMNERISILMVSFLDCIYLIDIVKDGKEVVEACKAALESIYVTKIIHDCKKDSEALYHQFGIKIQNIMDTEVAYRMIEEQEGRKPSHAFISLSTLLADTHYCGISQTEEEVGSLVRKDPAFWTHRPLSVLMIRAAAYRVRFLLQIYQTMLKKLSENSLWKLSVRGWFRSMCFCLANNKNNDWPSRPSFPDSLVSQGHVPEKEILTVLEFAPGNVKKFMEESGDLIENMLGNGQVEIVEGGSKGLNDKLFIIGPEEQVIKVEGTIIKTIGLIPIRSVVE